MPSMSSRIRRARSAARLSQSQLAMLTGVQRSAVAQWEREEGGTSPNVEHLALVAVSTKVRFEWLATGRGVDRLDGNEFELAVMVQDFAQDELESRVLDYVRRLSPKKRQMVCAILEMLSG